LVPNITRTGQAPTNSELIVADAEAIYSYEGTREMNTLIVGKSINRVERVRVTAGPHRQATVARSSTRDKNRFRIGDVLAL
jgi:hypothetical protein